MEFLIIAHKKNKLQPDMFTCNEMEIKHIHIWACENRYDSIEIKIKYEEKKRNEDETNSTERPENLSKNSTDDSCY